MSREQIVRNQKDIINQVNKNSAKGVHPSDKKQMQRMMDFMHASKGLKRR